MSSEFEFLESLRRKFSLGKIGDDCAMLPKDAETDMVITADMLVEDIDFRLEWTKPEFLGHKALAVSLSDIAAMGAEPKWAMLSLAIPESIWASDLVDRFYAGWHKLAAQFNVELIGGDISRTNDKLVIDSIVGGEVEKSGAVLRSTANKGDAIFVTGELGGAAKALEMLEKGERYDSSSTSILSGLLLKQLQPTPQVTFGKLLQKQQLATAMIDLSDGLSSDLGHICRASGVGATIYANKIPLNEATRDLFESRAGQLDLALNGGEDFELLFTADKKNISLLEKSGFLRIGEITANEGIIELIDGLTTSVLTPKGYRHF